MKKNLSIILIPLLALSLAACGGNEGNVNNSSDNQSVSDAEESDNEPDEEQVSISSALELLTTVWGSYTDDEKFPVAGGDMSEENMTTDTPGKFGIDDAGLLDTNLGFPAASVETIDDAASMVHMMNANTFTCGAFHIKNEDDDDDLTAAIKDNIMKRQWLCGFPDKLVIVKISDYVVSFFGEKELVDTFKTKLTDSYASAEIICDEPITE